MQAQGNEKVACKEEGCDKPARSLGLCRTHYHKVWRARNPELHRENGKRWYEKNFERRQEYARQYYLKNRERILEREREHQASPEYRAKKVEAATRWAKANPDRVRANQRRSWAKKKYGLTLEEYEAIIARGCAVCGTHDGRIVGRRGNLGGTIEARLCLDHDHANGKVRDALCHSCNTAIGQMGDDPTRLRAAADYIEKHRKEVVPK